MKKMISALFSAALTVIAIAGTASAQSGDKEIAFIPAKNHAAYVAFVNQNSIADENTLIADSGIETKTDATTKAAKANFKAVKANAKAVKAFNASYKGTTGAQWSIEGKSMIASFTKDDIKTNVVYDKKGNWFHTLTYYFGEKTPKDVVEIIDFAYPKDDIKMAVKVEEGNMQFYIVQLEGKTTLRKVTVHNGEANVIEELIKSN